MLKRKLKSEWILNEIQLSGTDPERLWKLYNYLTGKHEPPEVIEPECMTQDKANNYNEYFGTIGETLVKHPKNIENVSLNEAENSQTKTENQATFSFQKETPENVEKFVDALKEKIATGYNEINVKLIKDLKKEISTILTDLIIMK